MKKISLDPRINRIDFEKYETFENQTENDQFITYEVFHQKKKGKQHAHVGIVHAPNQEMAMVFAKEQYGRRGQSSGLWVVKSSEIFSTAEEDADIFEEVPNKLHREPAPYMVKEKIKAFKAKNETK